MAFLGAPAASADSLMQSETFIVNPFYDVKGAQTVDATLRRIGDHVYLYLDDRYWDGLTATQRARLGAQLIGLSETFDDAIYPRAHALWGSEASPGVDGDPRLTVLLEQLTQGSAGYYENVNNYPKSRASDSNEREMVYISADSLAAGSARNFLAHEFQHLISFSRRETAGLEPEDTWLNEARAEYAVTSSGFSEPYAGSGLERRASSYLRSPSNSLVDWRNNASDYAVASLFAHYLVERFGEGILGDTMTSERVGVEALDAWLVAHGRTERIESVFADWMAAVYANDRSAGTQYGYLRDGLDELHVEPSQTTSVDGSSRPSWSADLQELQPMWLRASIPQRAALPPEFSFSVQGDAGVQWLGTVIVEYGNGVRVTPWRATDGRAVISVPTSVNGSRLEAATIAVTQGSQRAYGERSKTGKPVHVTAALGPLDLSEAQVVALGAAPGHAPQNGDLVRRAGQTGVYVVWDGYRRYLADGVIALYGFQDRPVYEISDAVFFGLKSSNYIRTEGEPRVYAVWPDGTKHWLNITAKQWEDSGRDWGAIFLVNEHESSFYHTGDDITR